MHGERVDFDVLEIKKKDFVAVEIDYFTRKVFARSIKSKEACKILEFIKEVFGYKYKIFVPI